MIREFQLRLEFLCGRASSITERRRMGAPFDQASAAGALAQLSPRQLFSNAAIAAYLVLRRRVFWCDPPILRSPIGWRTGRPREFPRPRRAANRCDDGGAASAPRSLPGSTPARTWLDPSDNLAGRTRCSSSRLRATSGRLHWSLQCPFVAERRW